MSAGCAPDHTKERKPVTVTIGVAAWSGYESLEDTIQRADKAMYRGKNSGRNRVVIDTAAVMRAAG